MPLDSSSKGPLDRAAASQPASQPVNQSAGAGDLRPGLRHSPDTVRLAPFDPPGMRLRYRPSAAAAALVALHFLRRPVCIHRRATLASPASPRAEHSSISSITGPWSLGAWNLGPGGTPGPRLRNCSTPAMSAWIIPRFSACLHYSSLLPFLSALIGMA